MCRPSLFMSMDYTKSSGNQELLAVELTSQITKNTIYSRNKTPLLQCCDNQRKNTCYKYNQG